MSCFKITHTAIFLLTLPALASQYSSAIRNHLLQEFEICQETWELGPGYPGPYPSPNSWGDGFDTCSVANWYTKPNSRRTAPIPLLLLTTALIEPVKPKTYRNPVIYARRIRDEMYR